VIHPVSKKSVVRVSGEWNGKMTAKWADGSSGLFVDVSSLGTHKKICRKVDEQEPFESRRLWKEVTHGLKVTRRTKNVYILAYTKIYFIFLQYSDGQGPILKA
jgi:hypothetical protein